jgi:oxygen-dependent protoporphyrinogen oxidase
MRVAVVGGGISGLAAAYRLAQAGADVTLYEASSRLGGVVRTERRDGYLMEAGPDSFIDKAGIVELCGELGLADQLIRVQPGAQRSFIARGRRLLPIPEGLYLMAPSAFGPFLRSPVVSAAGKARMLLDLVLPPRRGQGDESLGHFVRRRLGREALERLAQPLLGGIYGADPERLSLAATTPQFMEMEQNQGGVIRGLLARSERASGARYGLFYSLRGGMQALVDALAERIPMVRLGARVDSAAELQADAVCLAVPLPEVARLLPALPLPRVEYSPVATINFGFRRSQVQERLDGAGFVVPAVEGRTIMACTISSQKFEGRAPADRVLLRAFAGGMLGQAALELTDAELIAAALGDVNELLGIHGEPDAVWLNRLPCSMPQYGVGHLEALAQLEAGLPANVALAGNGYRGVGIPDCIASGFAAAARAHGLSGRR